MADDKDPNKNEPHQSHEKDKSEIDKIQDKYEQLKNDPKVQQTKNFIGNYFVETFYLIATVLAFIITLIKHPYGGVIFVGIGFLAGLLLFPMMKKILYSVGNFFSKQELVIHVIISIIAIILAVVIPSIMFGVLVGIPAGFGVRAGVAKTHNQK